MFTDSQVRKTRCRQEQDLTPQGSFCTKDCKISEQTVTSLSWIRRRDSAETPSPPARVWASLNRKLARGRPPESTAPGAEGVFDLLDVAVPLQKSIQRIQPNRKRILFFFFFDHPLVTVRLVAPKDSPS